MNATNLFDGPDPAPRVELPDGTRLRACDIFAYFHRRNADIARVAAIGGDAYRLEVIEREAAILAEVTVQPVENPFVMLTNQIAVIGVYYVQFATRAVFDVLRGLVVRHDAHERREVSQDYACRHKLRVGFYQFLTQFVVFQPDYQFHEFAPVCGNRNSNQSCEGEAIRAGERYTGTGQATDGGAI